MNKQQRTQRLIDHFKRWPENEYTKLQGVLCMGHPFSIIAAEDKGTVNAIDDLFDSMMIAERMDAINAARLAA